MRGEQEQAPNPPVASQARRREVAVVAAEQLIGAVAREHDRHAFFASASRQMMGRHEHRLDHRLIQLEHEISELVRE